MRIRGGSTRASSSADPGPLGQATVHWGRQFAYPNGQFPAPMRLWPSSLEGRCGRPPLRR
ncbi:hypothetical protein HMPREF1550_01430 [Actinomyces sp. oral taxon 877 str. F0543]|nr:hypothetical protein HMPREF1550_01430 [Actinomyces sp. oral taxon 877 str. F0543]